MAGLFGDVTGFLVVFARVGAFLLVLPVFSEEAIPGRLRLLIALGMALGLQGMLASRVPPAAAEGALAGAVVAELLVGLAMGAIVRILFQAAVMAGAIIATQVGLTSAIVADFSQGGQIPVLARFIAVAAAVVCLAAGVHHLWIAAVIHSYDIFPVGGLPPAEEFARLAIDTSGRALVLALGLAAPLLVYGIVFNVALSLAARVAPAIQVFFIAQPLNLLLGLALFALVAGSMLTAFATALADWTRSGWG